MKENNLVGQRRGGILGHVLDVLKTLPSDSVQCAVTSPPYWGLRDYKIEPQVWDAAEGCDHEWVDGTKKGISGGTASDKVQCKGEENFQITPDSQYAFCLHCHAWRGSLGIEPTPELFVQHIVQVFREVKRVLRKDGTCWLNLGDSYSAASTHAGKDKAGIHAHGEESAKALRGRDRTISDGLKPKDLCGIPWRCAFALQADGWYLRSDIIWSKPNPMPESVTDRPARSHEYIFLLTKSQKYHFDQEAVREEANGYSHGKGSKLHPPIEDAGIGHKDWHKYTPDLVTTRNRRSVWEIPTQPTKEAHFATFPEKLVKICLLAGTSPKACGHCGAPYRRVVEKIKHERHESENQTIGSGRGDNADRGKHALPTDTFTLGFALSCKCPPDDTGKCVVLDPFHGSGTVGKVAESLGLDWIGIDLNPNYNKIAEKRTATTLGMNL